MKTSIQFKETISGEWVVRRKNCFGIWRYFTTSYVTQSLSIGIWDNLQCAKIFPDKLEAIRCVKYYLQEKKLILKDKTK